MAGLQEPPLRGLLLPGVRAAPRAARLVPRERLPQDLDRPQARDAEADPGHLLQDPLRVRADEPLPRLRPRGGGRLHRAAPQPDGDPHRRAVGPAPGAHHPRDGPRLRLRPHPARDRLRDTAAGHPALGGRGPRRLLPGHLGAARPHDDPGRGAHRQGARSSRGRSSRPSPAASSTTWATPATSSWRRATARRGSGSSSTRCARASSAARRRSSSSRPSARPPRSSTPPSTSG